MQIKKAVIPAAGFGTRMLPAAKAVPKELLPVLEERLNAGGKRSLLQSIATLADKVKIHCVRQPSQRGLGDAVWQARHHVGDAPFLCLLGDTIFSGGGPPARAVGVGYQK